MKKIVMYNLFTEHPKENGMKSWWAHCKSACLIGFRLYFTSWFFIIHGIFPFIPIPKKLNLTDSACYLLKENEERETKHQIIKCSHCNRNDGTCGCEKNGNK